MPIEKVDKMRDSKNGVIYSGNYYGRSYYDEQFNFMFYTKDYQTYDNKGNLLFLNNIEINNVLAPGLYACESNSGAKMIAVNEIPKPLSDTAGNFICLALDNPLININGEIRLLEERNYFFIPLLENDRTLIPLRVIFEALGADVLWDEETQTVTATKDGTIVTLSIGKYEMTVNENINRMDVPARLCDDRTFMPLRAVSEAFGANVNFDEETKLITIDY